MIDFGQYVGLDYDRFDFNCWHLVHKVLDECYDQSLPASPDVNILKPLGSLINEPIEGCVVLMYNPITKEPDHAGVYIGKGKVLHNHSSSYGSLISHFRSCERLFSKVECYAVNNNTS